MKLFAKRNRSNEDIVEETFTETKLVVESDGKIMIAHQDLRAAPRILSEKYCNWVQVLDLSHNKIRNLNFLRDMKVLHTLILDHNLVVSTSVFPSLPMLRILWLNYNLVADLGRFVPRLAQSCPGLQHLSLMGNRAAMHFVTGGTLQQQDEYRLYVIGHFDSLTFLDDRAISPIERLRSFQEETTIIDDFMTFARDLKMSIIGPGRSTPNSIV